MNQMKTLYEERSTAGTRDGESSESDHEPAQETVVYQDRRQRKDRGNRYQDIIAWFTMTLMIVF